MAADFDLNLSNWAAFHEVRHYADLRIMPHGLGYSVYPRSTVRQIGIIQKHPSPDLYDGTMFSVSFR